MEGAVKITETDTHSCVKLNFIFSLKSYFIVRRYKIKHLLVNAFSKERYRWTINNEDLNVFTFACIVLNPDQNYQNYHLRQRVLND